MISDMFLIIREQFAFLIGGFASSPWFSEQLEKRLLDIGFQFSKPEMDT